jgi:hypothetical protein
MNSNLINQQAFNAGFQEQLSKKAWDFYDIPLLGPATKDVVEGFGPGTAVAGVSVPLLAAAWYWHNKREAEKESLKQESMNKQALFGELGLAGGLATAGFPILGIIGAYQLAEYMRNRQEVPAQPSLDTILNVTPEGNQVATQEKKQVP